MRLASDRRPPLEATPMGHNAALWQGERETLTCELEGPGYVVVAVIKPAAAPAPALAAACYAVAAQHSRFSSILNLHQDPYHAADAIPKVRFSTPNGSPAAIPTTMCAPHGAALLPHLIFHMGSTALDGPDVRLPPSWPLFASVPSFPLQVARCSRQELPVPLMWK